MSDPTGTLVPFNYGDAQVRVVTIEGEPWFVLADLCKVLGLDQVNRVKSRLADGDTSITPIRDALGRTQSTTVVSEPGMYEVVIRSDKPEAAAFRRWITGTVLPEIRKTGGYQSSPALTGTEPDEVIVHRALQITYRKVQELEAANSEMQPKAAYFDEFVADEDLILFRTLANQLEVGEKALREALIARKWIYRVTGRRWSNKKNGIVSVHQYRPYADKKHLFRLVPCHDAPRVNGEVQQALKLTPSGAESVARAVKKWGSQPQLSVMTEGDEALS